MENCAQKVIQSNNTRLTQFFTIYAIMLVICNLHNNVHIFHLLIESNCNLNTFTVLTIYGEDAPLSSECVLFVQAPEYEVMEGELILLVNNHMTIRCVWKERGHCLLN